MANYYRNICYSDDLNLYVMVGFNAKILTSSDGIEWTERTADNGFSEEFNACCYGGGLFVIAGRLGEIQTSTDGITWTHRNADNSYSNVFYSVIYSNGLFVLVGYTETQTSTDGITWTHRTNAVVSAWEDIAYGIAKYVSVGWFGRIQTSTNGITWTQRTPADAFAGDFYGVSYINNLFLATGHNGTVQTSVNGEDWLTYDMGQTSYDVYKIIYGNGTYVAICEDGIIYTTTSLLNSWTLEDSSLSTSYLMRRGIYNDGIFFIVGGDGTNYSLICSIPTGNDVYPSVSEPIIRRTGLNFSGNDYKKVIIRLKQSDPNYSWNATLYWQTALHSESISYSVFAAYDADTNYNYKFIEFDMSEVTDWINSDITGIRLDINYDDWSSVTSGIFEIDYISINDIYLTWTVNHNLNSGGLIVQCFDSNGYFINPKNIKLTNANTTTITFSEEIVGSVNIVYLPKTFVITSSDDDLLGINIGTNLGYWKVGNGTTYNYDSIKFNDIESVTASGSYNRVLENDAGTHYNVEFIVEEDDIDLTITEMGLFNQDDQLMFYTTCSPLFKPAGIDLKVFYRIEKLSI